MDHAHWDPIPLDGELILEKVKLEFSFNEHYVGDLFLEAPNTKKIEKLLCNIDMRQY